MSQACPSIHSKRVALDHAIAVFTVALCAVLTGLLAINVLG